MSSQQLAQALISQGIVTEEQIKDALQRQVIFGGSLDTILMEEGLVQEQQMLECLRRAFRLAAVGKNEIDRIGPHMSRLFPLLFAETYHLVPYSLDQQDFGVLLNAPPDDKLKERIKERLQLDIVPIITSEVRLHYAMHRLYGTELLPRFRNLLNKLDQGEPSTEATSPSGEHVLSWGVSGAHIAPTRVRGQKDSSQLDVRGLMARLDSATDRDTIVEVLLGATLATFQFTALFLVQGERVNGWRSTDPISTQRVARVSLPLDLPSVLQTVYDTGAHYLGQLPSNAQNEAFLANLARQTPRTAFLAPITVGERIAAILYADNGSKGIPSKRIAAILLLAQRAGLSFENLIQRRKRSGTPSSPSPQSETTSVPEPTPPPMLAQPAPAPAQEPGHEPVWEDVDAADIQSADLISDTPKEHTVEAGDVEALEGGAGVEDEYVAFADIDDDPTTTVDDWEDVLLETMAAEAVGAPPKAGRSKGKAAPPAVTWEDVIAEAERAALTAPERRSERIEVAGTVMDEQELLFDNLDSTDEAARRHAVDKLASMGSRCDEALLERFPGHIAFDPLDLQAQVPPFANCSGLAAVLATRGVDATAVVLPHLESQDPIKRFFAIYYFMTVSYPPAIPALARRLYDSEPRNRYLAADALRTYAADSSYRQIVQSLRDQLKVPVLETQITTVQVLGQLREPSAVPSLIPLVVANHAELSQAAASALAVICCQSFGRDVTAWAQWWQQHYSRPRITWLLESMDLDHPGVQQLANSELQLLTGRAVPFDPHASREERAQAGAAWKTWWREVTNVTPKPKAPMKDVSQPA